MRKTGEVVVEEINKENCWDFKNFWMFDILNEILLIHKTKVSKRYKKKGLKVFEKNKFDSYGQVCLCIEYLKNLKQNMSDKAESELNLNSSTREPGVDSNSVDVCGGNPANNRKGDVKK